MNDREICYKVLYDIFINERLSHEALKETLDLLDKQKTQVNKAFITRVVNGVTERWLTLTFIISNRAGRPIGKIKPALRIIMAMAIYQGVYMSVPVSAACDEAVKLTKKHKLNGLAGFVNGVLRNFFREVSEKNFDEYLEELIKSSKLDKYQTLEVKYSCPVWLVKHYLKYMSETEVCDMLKASFTERKTTVYRLRSKSTEEEFEAELSADNVKFEKIDDITYELDVLGSSMGLKAFKKGMFIIQDRSSIKASEVAPISEYKRILDLCAAPGGKSIHTADRFLSAGGHVLSCDVSENKVKKIKENIKRVGLSNIECAVNDATVFNPKFENVYDYVICDVPCSGLGVIGKKPDIKYKTKPEDIISLQDVQRKIIDNAVKYVKAGGYIIYSTCTIAKGENEEGSSYIKDYGFTEIESRQLFIDDKSDGFYYALLKKN